MYDQANESEIMSWEIPADIEFYYSPFFGTDLAMPEWEAIITLVLLSAVILTTIIGNILVNFGTGFNSPLNQVLLPSIHPSIQALWSTNSIQPRFVGR
jgi:hypothetical protein